MGAAGSPPCAAVHVTTRGTIRQVLLNGRAPALRADGRVPTVLGMHTPLPLVVAPGSATFARVYDPHAEVPEDAPIFV